MSKHDIKESEGNIFNPVFKENVQRRDHPGSCALASVVHKMRCNRHSRWTRFVCRLTTNNREWFGVIEEFIPFHQIWYQYIESKPNKPPFYREPFQIYSLLWKNIQFPHPSKLYCPDGSITNKNKNYSVNYIAPYRRQSNWLNPWRSSWQTHICLKELTTQSTFKCFHSAANWPQACNLWCLILHQRNNSGPCYQINILL